MKKKVAVEEQQKETHRQVHGRVKTQGGVLGGERAASCSHQRRVSGADVAAGDEEPAETTVGGG